jgi:hypothetical protein
VRIYIFFCLSKNGGQGYNKDKEYCPAKEYAEKILPPSEEGGRRGKNKLWRRQ